MYYSFCILMIIFFIYSFIGYVSEVISVSSKTNTVTLSRGYLIGPYLPIFGMGGLLMTLLLKNYKDDIIVLFVMSFVICSLLEYFTSLIMEKIFKIRWWDYSDRLINVNGRICLGNGIMFGLGGIAVIRFLYPTLLSFLYSFSDPFIYFMGTFLFVVILSDFIISTYTILQLKIDLTTYTDKDSTMRIRRDVLNSVRKYGFIHRRLYKAFPNITGNRIVSKFQRISRKKRKKQK